MKIVLCTQDRENYGAHAWDGQGECPAHWKYKGGDTYIVEGVGIDEAQSPDFWALVENSVSQKSDGFESYVISSNLVDDCEENAQWCEDCEAPIILTVEQSGRILASKESNTEMMPVEFIGHRAIWEQKGGMPVENTHYQEYLKSDDFGTMTVVNWKGEKIENPVLFDVWLEEVTGWRWQSIEMPGDNIPTVPEFNCREQKLVN